MGEVCSDDCGPWDLETPFCEECRAANGIMFDVTAKDSIAIDTVETIVLPGLANVKLYTASGRFNRQHSDKESWIEIGSRAVAPTEESWITFEFDFINLSKGETVSFYVASSNKLKIGEDDDGVDDPIIQDEKIQFRSPGRAFVGETPFGKSYKGYSL